MDLYKVAIVDDHSLFAESLQKLIDTFHNFKVHFIANNGQELITIMGKNSHSPDIILLDINMPHMNGIQTMRWLKSNHPDLAVLALSMDDSEETIIQMLRHGAKGYLLKDINPDELEYAFHEVIKKGFYYTDKVNNYLLKSLENGSKHGHESEDVLQLNDREVVFLDLACTDMTYKEIANEMCISIKTVDGYRDNLFKKFGVSNRIGLVLFAIRNKLVDIR